MPPVTRSVTCSVQGEPAAARHVDLGPRLRDALATLPPSIAPATALRTLVDAGLDELPLPGSGHTLDRFRALAAVAAHDLSLAKLYEGHTDALAIMAELGAPPPPPGALVGTWAAEAKDARVAISGRADETRLVGRKAWCSATAAR